MERDILHVFDYLPVNLQETASKFSVYRELDSRNLEYGSREFFRAFKTIAAVEAKPGRMISKLLICDD